MRSVRGEGVPGRRGPPRASAMAGPAPGCAHALSLSSRTFNCVHGSTGWGPVTGSSAPRRTAWIVAPPSLCTLCKGPLTSEAETSAWNGQPAHRDCVRIHLLQRDPAFRDWGGEPPAEDAPEEGMSDLGNREDDEDGPE